MEPYEPYVRRNDDGSVYVIRDVEIPDPGGRSVLRNIVNIPLVGPIEVFSEVVILD